MTAISFKGSSSIECAFVLTRASDSVMQSLCKALLMKEFQLEWKNLSAGKYSFTVYEGTKDVQPVVELWLKTVPPAPEEPETRLDVLSVVPSLKLPGRPHVPPSSGVPSRPDVSRSVPMCHVTYTINSRDTVARLDAYLREHNILLVTVPSPDGFECTLSIPANQRAIVQKISEIVAQANFA